MASTAPSRASLADYVLSKMAPSKASRTTSVGEYAFSRLQQAGEESPRDRAGPCFTGLQLGMPMAASHEAPLFTQRESSRALLRGGIPEGPLETSPLPHMQTAREDSRSQREMRLQEAAQQQPQPQQTEPLSPPLSRLPPVLGEAAPTQSQDVQTIASPLPSPEVRQEKTPQERSPPSRSPPSPASVATRVGSNTHVRAIKLSGFHNSALNDVFVENHDPEYMVNGRETYWSYTGDFFLYRSESTNTWGAAKAKRLVQVREGKGNGVAHSPEGFEIWQQGAVSAKKAWREWDTETKKWTLRTGSGVESRGKVRKKESPPEKGTQTDFQGVNVSPRIWSTQEGPIS